MSVDVRVFFKINGVQVQVGGVGASPNRVRGIGGQGGVQATFGQRDLSSETPPLQLQIELNDPSGVFNPRNAYGPYYGLLNVGIECTIQIGASDVRLVGEVAGWKARIAGPAGRDTVVTVNISDFIRRQQIRNQPFRSPAYRALTTAASRAEMIAYWPMEDGSEATTYESVGAAAGSLIVSSGGVSFGSYTQSPVCERMPSFSNTAALEGAIVAVLPTYTSTNEWRIFSQWKWPDAGPPGVAGVAGFMRLYFRISATSNCYFIDVIAGSGTPGAIELIAHGPTGPILDTSTALNAGPHVLGKDFGLMIDVTQNGADLDTTVTVWIADPTSTADSVSQDYTMTGVSVGPLFRIDLAIDDLTGCSVGALAVSNDSAGWSAIRSNFAFRGHAGERAGRRLQRLCAEGGLTFSTELLAALDQTEPMGPQGAQSGLDLMRECADVDMGILVNARTANQPSYTPRVALYNNPGLPLTYAAPTAHLSGDLTTVDDDFGATNDVTAVRSSRVGSGGTARVSFDTPDGYHSTTQDPTVNPAGINPRPTRVDVNVASDDQLTGQAGWRAHLGSWNEPRYEKIAFDLQRSIIAGNPTLLASIAALYAGKNISVNTAGAPGWLPTDQIDVMIRGGQEVLGQAQREMVFSALPARMWEVETVDTGGSTLLAAVDIAAATWRVGTSLGPEWYTGAPYYVQGSGEAVRVTACVTATPAFVAAGTLASGNNASVVPGLPAGLTPDVGHIQILFAAIRASGTATVNQPAGWLDLVNFGNVRIMYRYLVTGDTAPTVSFTGGAAGDDTQARIAGFTGLSHYFASGTKRVPAAATQLNGSAQNMAVPAMTMRRDGMGMWFGWKQDDWTSVATLSGATEWTDSPTTTGNDQGIVGDYQAVSGVSLETGQDFPATSFVVTGGAGAISRTIAFGLRPLQTLTVTRNQNGTNVSIAAGAAIKAWRPGVNGL